MLSEFGVLPELSRAVDEMGWTLPTDVQAEAVPLIGIIDKAQNVPEAYRAATLGELYLAQSEPLADAIAHEVIADLSRLQWLRVISGASTFKLRGEYHDVQDSARLLGVQYVLNGTLSLFGERSEVIVELTHVDTMETVWAEPL